MIEFIELTQSDITDDYPEMQGSVSFTGFFSNFGLIRLVNDKSKEGWEFVQTLVVQGSPPSIVFKREIQ